MLGSNGYKDMGPDQLGSNRGHIRHVTGTPLTSVSIGKVKCLHNSSDVIRLAGGLNNIGKVLMTVATHSKYFLVISRSVGSQPYRKAGCE